MGGLLISGAQLAINNMANYFNPPKHPHKKKHPTPKHVYHNKYVCYGIWHICTMQANTHSITRHNRAKPQASTETPHTYVHTCTRDHNCIRIPAVCTSKCRHGMYENMLACARAQNRMYTCVAYELDVSLYQVVRSLFPLWHEKYTRNTRDAFT